MKPKPGAGCNVLMPGENTVSLFFDFCLTVGVIYRNQHGPTQTQNRQSGEVGATSSANSNAEHKVIPVGGFWGGQPQTGGV
jgi:hypothetical protein